MNDIVVGWNIWVVATWSWME